jgi:PhoH-like ATPase
MSREKIFVLDTSVIIYDHEAINHFGPHDVAIPIVVLEELDNFKKGNDSKNFFAREFIRQVDAIAAEHTLQDWVPMARPESGRFKVLHREASAIDAREVFNGGKADHRIINAALKLQEEEPTKLVVLVTKDIALRLKAKALICRLRTMRLEKLQTLTCSTKVSR